MIKTYRKLGYSEQKEREVVFYEGDKGRKFYIIINGSVDILEEIKKKSDQKVVFLREAINKRKLNSNGKEFDEFENSEVVNTLYTGDSFGEIALTNEIPRTASVRCTSPLTAFVTLS